MSDQAVLVIAAIAALVIVIALFKILGSLVRALVIALVAAGALYLLLPRLEAQEGAVGEAARKAREVTTELEGEVDKLKARAREATDQLEQGFERAQDAAEAVEKATEAADLEGAELK